MTKAERDLLLETAKSFHALAQALGVSKTSPSLTQLWRAMEVVVLESGTIGRKENEK